MNGPGPEAETRVVRTITTVLGLAAVVLGGLTSGKIIAEASYLHPAWLLPAVAAVFVGPPVIALIAQRATLDRIRILLGTYAILFFLAAWSFPLAMVRYPMPFDLSPWPLALTALGSVAAAMAWRPAAAWIYTVLNCTVLWPVREIASGGPNAAIPIQDAIFTVVFVMVFFAVALVSVRNGQRLDRATVLARASTSAAAYEEARAQEQARLDALVHDQIMTTLLYAAQGEPQLRTSVRSQAKGALEQLERLSGTIDEDAVPPAEFVSRLRATSLDIAPHVEYRVEGARTHPIPAIVADALSEATMEAMRNSVRHAADLPGIRRTVSVRLEEDGVEVQVGDDGPGFDRRSVGPHRLGIAVSIEQRLRAIAGGTAAVHSVPGRGTTVDLRWHG